MPVTPKVISQEIVKDAPWIKVKCTKCPTKSKIGSTPINIPIKQSLGRSKQIQKPTQVLS